MAKGPKAPANTGKVPSETGAKHDANCVKTGKTNLAHQAKHAGKPKPGKAGSGKK